MLSIKSLAGFWALPLELQQGIVALACGPPAIPRHTRAGRSTDCTTTMLRLLQAGRAFSGLATPLLYSHVRLSRPSGLRAFHQTLATQPELGLLVESLHIGEDDALPNHWWPLRTTGRKEPDYDSEDDQSERWLDHLDYGTPEPKDPYRIFFRLNLGGEGRWRGCLFYEHELNAPNDLDAAHLALDRAFDAASRDLDVNLQRRDRNYAERKISVNTWHIRVLEVQAAVELYYLDMLRRYEQAQTAASRKEVMGVLETPFPYPSLRVGKEAASTLTSGESAVSKVFNVSRSQLLERLASAGSPADRFEHPLVCARSEVGWHAGALDGEAHYADSGDQIVDRPAQTPEDFPHSWEPIAVLHFEALLATPVGENLALARDVLCLTPRVRSLSLTGNFDLCLTSELLTWQAHCLQAVTLGPCQTDWDKTLALSHPAIRTTKSLRVCQGLLPREEFGWISGSSDALPQLEEFHWIMSFKYCWGDNQP